MRKVLSLAGVVAFGLLGMAAQGATTVHKKSTGKKGSVASTHKSAPRRTSSSAHATAKRSGAPSRTATTRRRRTTAQHHTASRSRQLSPSPDRYKEIQEALAAKGYLTAEQANGKWDDASTAALRKFQTDQNLDGNGKINSLSLIALGLGPKRETAAAIRPAAAVPATPIPATPGPEPAPDATANP